MQITTLGDIALDVVVEVVEVLHSDDDTEAHISLHPGGQAANVAAWASALGASATVIGPLLDSGASLLLRDALNSAGVDIVSVGASAPGTVVSMLAAGTRTMASDAGDQGWLSSVGPDCLPETAEWLHVSSYPLLRAADPGSIVGLAQHARRHQIGLSLDLSSAALIQGYGAQRFRALVAQLAPEVVFANELEWTALGVEPDAPPYVLVLKHGADGVSVWERGACAGHRARPTAMVDVTGAGDALAAGYLVGGIELAMTAAARCVGQHGAQPHPSQS